MISLDSSLWTLRMPLKLLVPWKLFDFGLTGVGGLVNLEHAVQVVGAVEIFQFWPYWSQPRELAHAVLVLVAVDVVKHWPHRSWLREPCLNVDFTKTSCSM